MITLKTGRPCGGMTLYVREYFDALEWIKWLAFGAMLCDHVDLVLFDRQLTWLHSIGRFAFPAFAIAFGIGLARSRDPGEVGWRLFPPAVVAGFAWVVLTMPPYLNVLFVFALCAFALDAWRSNRLYGALLWLAVLLAGGYGLLEAQFMGPLLVAAGVALGAVGWWPAVLAAGGLAAALAPSVGLVAGVLAPLAYRAPLPAFPRVPGLLAWCYALHLWVLAGLRLVLP